MIRSSVCANKINNLLGLAVGARYVEKKFNDEAKVEVIFMTRAELKLI